jgi:DAK2 domain fusion protein YloV
MGCGRLALLARRTVVKDTCAVGVGQTSGTHRVITSLLAVHPERVDAGIARRWLLEARDALGRAREEIDGLNVFPVPDGDTGTNMYLTLDAAVRGVGDATHDTLPDVLHGAARGAFLGARGNSGVIFSQMFRGVVEVLTTSDETVLGAQVFADALRAGARSGYDAVVEPVEGTMLTVMRVAAAAGSQAADAGASLARVVRTVVTAADEAVLQTRQQHPTLARSGVVDAGGRGVAVVLGAMDTAMTGRPMSVPSGLRQTVPAGAGAVVAGEDLVEGGPAYEVMYLLEAPDEHVLPLRDDLAALGDSLLVVGGDGLWNVHVHVDDVGAAVERGIEAGRPFRIRVTHFADQVRAEKRSRHSGRAVVAAVAGPGLEQVFRSAGATTISAAPGRLASTEQIMQAILSTDRAEAVVLPNHRELVPAAEAAAHEAGEQGVHVAVIPTRAQVQGLAALAVHQADHSFDSDVVAMTAAAAHCRDGAVTIAAKQAMTSAGICEPGDVLGVVGRDFVEIGRHPQPVALAVLRRMLATGGELVTIITGAEAPDGLADALVDQLAEDHPAVDCAVYEGGQSRYLLLLGVE